MNFQTLNGYIEELPKLFPALDRQWDFLKFKTAPLFMSSIEGEVTDYKDLLLDLRDADSEKIPLPYKRVRVLDTNRVVRTPEDKVTLRNGIAVCKDREGAYLRMQQAWILGSMKGQYLSVVLSRMDTETRGFVTGSIVSGPVDEFAADLGRIANDSDNLDPSRFQVFQIKPKLQVLRDWKRTKNELNAAFEPKEKEDTREYDALILECNRIEEEGKKALESGDKVRQESLLNELEALKPGFTAALEKRKGRTDRMEDLLLLITANSDALQCHIGLVNFLSLVNHPGHHIVAAVPDNTEGKSVQWVESKTHYLVLHAMDGEKISTGGQKDFHTSTEVLTRAAHSRRAHYRTLSSPHFTHMKGQRIRVKASWVGPLEWKGTDKKIYRVLGQSGSQLKPANTAEALV